MAGNPLPYHDSLYELDRRTRQRERGRLKDDPVKYQGQPVAYARDYLKLDPGMWAMQEQIARAIHEPPYKILVKAAHGVGKTWLMAVLTSYWFDCFTESSAVITTAPTARDVRDLLWTEVRNIRMAAGLGGFRGTMLPELWDRPDHFAKGFTAQYGESFQGRHLKHMLFIFDEAIGVPPVFWQTTQSMFQPDGRHAWCVIGNPTDTTSQMYSEDLSGDWKTFSMSALDHPNIRRQLKGKEPLYPSAVTLAQVESWFRGWATEIPAGEQQPSDVAWPPPEECGCVRACSTGASADLESQRSVRN
jgi:hypothetical protein